MNIQDVEKSLNEIAIKSWERLRSSDELNSFLGRRELALSMIETGDFDDLI